MFGKEEKWRFQRAKHSLAAWRKNRRKKGDLLKNTLAEQKNAPLFWELFYIKSSAIHTLMQIAERSGGDNEARTRDLMTASHALSQLSYTPGTSVSIT